MLNLTKNRAAVAMTGIVAFGWVVLLAVGMISGSARADVKFKEATLAEAQKMAAKEKKVIMIDFYTDWCIWCKTLDRTTYSNQQVGDYANEHFVSLKINAEKGEGTEIAKKYGVTGYPTIVFISADAKEVSRVVGYQDAEPFMRSMKLAGEGGLSALVKKSLTKTGATDPGIWMELGEAYSKDNQRMPSMQSFDKEMMLDKYNHKKLKEQALYAKAFAMDTMQQIPALEQAYKEYPDRPEARQAFMILMTHDFHMGAYEAAFQRLNKWLEKHPTDASAMNAFAWSAAEGNQMLGQAEDMATRAVFATEDLRERAEILDTKAEVVFKSGRPADAVVYEQQALMLLKPDQDAKLIKNLQEQKEKFEKAAGTTVNGTVEAH